METHERGEKKEAKHINGIVKKVILSFYLLRSFRRFGMTSKTLANFCRCVVESVLTSYITVCVPTFFFFFISETGCAFLRIQQIETTLNILEAKLSSIPGLEDVTLETTRQSQNVSNGPSSNQHQPSPTEGLQNVASSTPIKADLPTENAITVAKDPRYARYLKMVQVGVPVMAIRNKMISEGLDPDLLETPNALVPDGVKEGDGDSSGSESSFSD
ncbi:WASH complex subunit 3 [Narcine bancroftii]|uniref:WASH complex subunit 3 n=1 Tax=Narcine bancroftii TaxID=1343680 RepID=UPI003831C6BB